MITTLTLNPAIDKTLIVNGFKVGSVNRVSKIIMDAGGKGINVAKNLKNLNDDVLCLGFMGPNGNFILDVLKNEGIKSDFTMVRKEIRTNTKIIDSSTKTSTDINEAGPEISDDELKDLIKSISNHEKSSNVITISGSIPPGVPKKFYADIIDMVKNKETKILLDAEGDALKYGITRKPYMIKPNIHELSQIVGEKLENRGEIIKEGIKLNDMGIPIVAISMGSDGSIIITNDKAYIVKPIKVIVKGTVGAGDAMVAGFAHGIANNLDIVDTIKIAAAASTSVIEREGTRPCTMEDIIALKDKIEIETIERR